MSPTVTSDRDLPLPQVDLPDDFFTAERLQQDAHLFDDEIEDEQDAFFDMGPDPRERDFYLDRPADWLDVTKRVTYDIQFLPHRLRPRTPPEQPSPQVQEALDAAEEAKDDVLPPHPQDEEPPASFDSDDESPDEDDDDDDEHFLDAIDIFYEIAAVGVVRW